MKNIWYVFVVGLFIFFGTGSASALTINPARVTVTVAPGESQIIALNVRNDNVLEKSYAAGVIGAEQDPAGHPMFRVGASDAEVWVVPNKKNFTIAPGKIETIYYTVTVPATAARGVAHFVGLAITESTGGGEVDLSTRLISLAEVQVAGFIQEHGTLGVWRSAELFFASSKWPLKVVVTNSGTGSAPLKATARISSWITRSQFLVPVSLGSNLLPGTSRQITVPLVIEKSLAPGIYSVRLDLAYGYTGQQLTKTAWVIYLPKYAQFLLVALVAVVIFLIMRIRSQASPIKRPRF